MPPTRAAAAAAATTPPPRRLVLLAGEPRQPKGGTAAPRRYRLARLEGSEAARVERFAHLKRIYD